LEGIKKHKHDNIPPEVGFVCAAVIVLKMVYGLDGEIRYGELPMIVYWDGLTMDRSPIEGDDPANAFPKLEEYLSILRKMDENDEDAMWVWGWWWRVTLMRLCRRLSGERLDEYLDFCERALLSPKESKCGLDWIEACW
jgi:RNA polymerase I-specific transcription initiation factor RRN7